MINQILVLRVRGMAGSVVRGANIDNGGPIFNARAAPPLPGAIPLDATEHEGEFRNASADAIPFIAFQTGFG
jgi:hypothetical protein